MAMLENKPFQATCIQAILDNFDEFCAAYNSFEGEVPKRNFVFLELFCRCLPLPWKIYSLAESSPPIPNPLTALPMKQYEFLQRKYSDALLMKLRKSGKLKDTHLPFLINKFVRVLDLRTFKRCSRNVVEKLLPKVSDTILKLTVCRYFCECSKRKTGACEEEPKQPHDEITWSKAPLRIDLSEDACRNYLVRPDSLRVHRPVMNKSCQHDKKLSSDSLGIILRDFHNLDSLVLAGTYCSDDTMMVIGQSCLSLKSLDVSFCPAVTELGLKNLFECDDNGTLTPRCTLRCLSIKESGVKDGGVEFVLKNMKSLEVLTHDRLARVLLEMHRKDLEDNTLSTAEKYNLTYLDIHMSSFATEDLFVHTTLCPKLKTLSLSCYTEEALMVCCRFQHLESIKLSGNYNTSIDSFLEVKGRELRSLDLLYCSVSVDIITRACPYLRTLSLFTVAFQNPKDWNLQQMNLLECFSEYIAESADDNSTIESTAALLAVCPRLEILRLVACGTVCPGINDAVLNCVTRLKEKDFRYSNVQLSFLETTLLRSSTLQKVDIRSTKEVFDWTDNLLDMLRLTKNPVDVHWNYFVGR